MNRLALLKTLIVSIVYIFGIVVIIGSNGKNVQSTPKYTPPPPAIYKSNPEVVTISNEFFDVKMSIGKIPDGFILEITNKTKKDMEVDWNKTQYIEGNSTKGGFMYEGIVYSKRTENKPPDVIFPGITLKKKILPNSNVEYLSSIHMWFNKPIIGDAGVYLVINIDGKEVKEKLLMNIVKIQ
jgi:hypothetical protein